MHFPDSVPAILVLFGLGVFAYGMNWPVSIPGFLAPPLGRSNIAILLGIISIISGMWTWYYEHHNKTNQEVPQGKCANLPQDRALEVDLDLVAQLDYPVALPDNAAASLDSAFYERQMANAMNFARDSVARVYGRKFGLSPTTLRSLSQDLDTFISFYRYRKCRDTVTLKCSLVVVLVYPLNPVGQMKALSESFDVPLKANKEITTDNIRLPAGISFATPDINFERAKYRPSDEQKLKLAILANILHRQVPAGKKIKLFCDGYASPELINPATGIAYGGAARCCPGTATIALSDTGTCDAVGQIIRDNRALSYVRAFEGASCLYNLLKDIDPNSAFLQNIEVYYRGNGIDTRNKQRKITFTPIF